MTHTNTNNRMRQQTAQNATKIQKSRHTTKDKTAQ